MFRINTYIGIFCLLVVSLPSWALRSDRDQPINIKADRVEVNEKTEISLYRGNVYLKQGTLVINADNVAVYLVKGKLTKIVIDGNPATFEQQPEDNKDIVQSSARHMEYYAAKQLLILKQEARVIQGANNFSGDFIEYDTLNSTVKASKEAGSESRVHAIIQPGGDKSEQDDQAVPEATPDPTPKPGAAPQPQTKPSKETTTK